MIISLTGFMGSGKSSIGRKLSERLCCRFMDLDEVIEEREGRKISEIFESGGEAAFRRMELDALKMVINEYSSSTEETLVLALGGGTVMTGECAELIDEYTSCIYLRASVDTLARNLEGEAAGRPLLQAGGRDLRGRIKELMGRRSSTYEATAHHIIDTDGKNPDELLLALVSCLNGSL